MSSPAHAALGDVLIEARPGFACGDDIADGIFQFRMNNITTEGQLELSKKRRVPRDTRGIDRYLVELGDVLFNATNSSNLVGKTAYFPGLEEPAVFSNHFLRLRPDADRLDGRFLSRWLALQFQLGRFKGICRQWVNQATVNRDALLAMQIPLPPLPDQRRIAEILDKADALRAKRRAALAQLDTLTQSIFLDMFGDPVQNMNGWKCVAMSDAVIGRYGIKAGPFGSSLKKDDYAPSGYRVYGQEQVIAGRFDIGDYYIGQRKFQQLRSCAVAEGDLLVSLVGSFGRVLIVPAGIEPGIINPRLVKISPNQDLVTSVFLASLLRHPTVQADLQRVAHGGTMGILNAGLLKQLKVILPTIDLQREFARRVAAAEKLKAAQHAALAETSALFAAIQHLAFRGEL